MTTIDVQGVSDVRISIAPNMISTRDEVVTLAAKITAIGTAADAEQTAAAIRGLRAVMKSVEDSRKLVKAPVLDLGKRIDALATEFVRDVDAQIRRLTSALTTYQAEQDRIAREEEARRQAEIRAAQERERKAREEEARLAREAAAAAATVEDDPFAAAEAEAARVQAAREAMAARKETIATVMTPVAYATQPLGVHTRRDPDFTVTNAGALALARPDLVTVTPKRALIIAEIRKIQEWDGDRAVAAVPGISARWVGKAVVR